MNKMCITVAEAAELASVPETVIREWAQDFDFPSMKIGKRGGKRLIHVESFNAWLAKRCQARIGEQKGNKWTYTKIFIEWLNRTQKQSGNVKY